MTDTVGAQLGGTAEPEDDHRSCPDCGGAVEKLPFTVMADSEEVAQRVFLAYAATRGVPVETLQLLAQGKAITCRMALPGGEPD